MLVWLIPRLLLYSKIQMSCKKVFEVCNATKDESSLIILQYLQESEVISTVKIFRQHIILNMVSGEAAPHPMPFTMTFKRSGCVGAIYCNFLEKHSIPFC